MGNFCQQASKSLGSFYKGYHCISYALFTITRNKIVLKCVLEAMKLRVQTRYRCSLASQGFVNGLQSVVLGIKSWLTPDKRHAHCHKTIDISNSFSSI